MTFEEEDFCTLFPQKPTVSNFQVTSVANIRWWGPEPREQRVSIPLWLGLLSTSLPFQISCRLTLQPDASVTLQSKLVMLITEQSQRPHSHIMIFHTTSTPASLQITTWQSTQSWQC